LGSQTNQGGIILFSTTIDSLSEVRLLIYKESCHKQIPADTMVSKVQAIDWNTTDIPITHSPYIDTFAELLEGFKRKFQNLQKTPISKNIQKNVWTMITSHIFDCLVEGYATSQCTNEGRAMMGMDFRHLQDKITSIIPPHLHPLPSAKLVEEFIKAYYLVDTDVELWLKKHLTNFTNKQLSNLINSGQWDPNTKRSCMKILGK